MKATVTLTRLVRQYTDVLVDSVESLDEATESIEHQLRHPASKAKLLKGLSWYDGSLEQPPSIDTAVNADDTMAGKES
jgi:hypothetical protein